MSGFITDSEGYLLSGAQAVVVLKTASETDHDHFVAIERPARRSETVWVRIPGPVKIGVGGVGVLTITVPETMGSWAEGVWE